MQNKSNFPINERQRVYCCMTGTPPLLIAHEHVRACISCRVRESKQASHLLEHLLMIIDEVAQLKRKTIKMLPVPESTLLMSKIMPGPALATADERVKPNGSNTGSNCTWILKAGGSCHSQCLYMTWAYGAKGRADGPGFSETSPWLCSLLKPGVVACAEGFSHLLFTHGQPDPSRLPRAP